MPPLRRPFGSLPGAARGGMPQQPMMPRPAMTGAPANNAGPGMPGPQSGMSGQPGGTQPPVPPPIQPPQPNAGGPTAPMNAGAMLSNQMGQTPGAPGQLPGSASAQRKPLMPWGGAGGNTGDVPQPATAMGTGDEDPFALGGSGAQADGLGSPQAPGGGMNPMLFLKMLKAQGRI